LLIPREDEWYPFVCESCESSRKTGSSNHQWTHPVVRVRYDAPTDGGRDDKDDLERRHDELKDRLEGIQNQVDKRMKTLEDNMATLQQNVDQKFGVLERMLSELLVAKTA
jgi:hypothetical protein